MNKDRRKAIGAIAVQLDKLRSMIEDLKSDAESLRDEERDYFDNMPESLQQGDRGQAAEAAADALDEAVSELENIDSSIDTIIDNLNTASE